MSSVIHFTGHLMAILAVGGLAKLLLGHLASEWARFGAFCISFGFASARILGGMALDDAYWMHALGMIVGVALLWVLLIVRPAQRENANG